MELNYYIFSQIDKDIFIREPCNCLYGIEKADTGKRGKKEEVRIHHRGHLIMSTERISPLLWGALDL